MSEDKQEKEQSLEEKLGATEGAAPRAQSETLKQLSDVLTNMDDEDASDAITMAIEKLEKTAFEAQDKALRAHAEVENIRRRAERDVAGAHKYALEKFVKELLPVLDSMGQALHHSHDNEAAQAIHEGVNMTMTMLLGVLNRMGVEEIDPLNQPFNPELHEAMSMLESADVAPDTVIQVFQKGYSLNGRLVRPARVIVSKAS